MERVGRPEEKLPPEISGLFGQLWQQTASLHFSWAALTELFNGDRKRVAVLQETAPAFFGSVRRALQESVVLAISRLTDPSTQGRFQNASLAALVDAVGPIAPELHSSLVPQLAALTDAAAPVRDRRNRVIAHLDSRTVLSSDPNPLPGVSREQFETSLSGIRSVMNEIEVYFADSSTGYDTPIFHGGADHLVFYLEQALEYEAEKRRRRL